MRGGFTSSCVHLLLAAFIAAVLLAGASACGQSVRPLSIHDTRLPLDARRWVADADDAVTVTAAWRDEAREAVEATLDWQEQTVEPIRWPATAEAASAQSALGELARARVRLARLELARAEAELALAEIRRTQVNAETAVRYDLRYYDLEPFQEETREARDRVEATTREAAEQRLAVEEATTEWWRAFQQYVQGGGDPGILWLERK